MTTLNELSSMTRSKLDRLYADAPAGDIPDGESNGKAIFMPGTWLGAVVSAIDNIFWKGKVFNRATGRLTNKILAWRFVPAEVFRADSWSDGKPSVIVDYRRTSWLCPFIRDEIRPVAPGVYLGKAYLRLPFGRRSFFLYFALDFRK